MGIHVAFYHSTKSYVMWFISKNKESSDACANIRGSTRNSRHIAFDVAVHNFGFATNNVKKNLS